MKKQTKIFKFIFVMCFVSYLTFYIAGQTGYYEYNARRKMTYTKEQIEKFEQDVKEGKNIDMEEYLKNTDKNYQNKISKATLSLSENISKITRKGINVIFSKIGNAIEN